MLIEYGYVAQTKKNDTPRGNHLFGDARLVGLRIQKCSNCLSIPDR